MLLKWFGERQAKRLSGLAKRRSKACAREAARLIVEEISIPGPSASIPGEYPHKQSGGLSEGVGIDESDLYWSVVSSAAHAGAVEQIRPYFMRAIRENIASINQAVGEDG